MSEATDSFYLISLESGYGAIVAALSKILKLLIYAQIIFDIPFFRPDYSFGIC